MRHCRFPGGRRRTQGRAAVLRLKSVFTVASKDSSLPVFARFLTGCVIVHSIFSLCFVSFRFVGTSFYTRPSSSTRRTRAQRTCYSFYAVSSQKVGGRESL